MNYTRDFFSKLAVKFFHLVPRVHAYEEHVVMSMQALFNVYVNLVLLVKNSLSPEFDINDLFQVILVKHHSMFVLPIHVNTDKTILSITSLFHDCLLGLNGGTCVNQGNGLFTCTCPAAFTGKKSNSFNESLISISSRFGL